MINCFVSGSVLGVWEVVGRNHGSIVSCYAVGNVEGGGLVGYNAGEICNS
ncbi:MAG: hypothetical protein M0Q40_10195 [Limnochordia bacterium]|nr:hypothetical protein [Limnochordia bacterium]MDD4518591.1 hypothetical protein [Limnochordia bacterium]